MATYDGQWLYNGLIQRGYAPYQAAALAGHMLQESGGNPAAVTQEQGAPSNGLLQWRGDRFGNLQNFAKSQGKDWRDPNVQLDFIGREMSGPEAKAGASFNASTDVPSASAALKSYIRFGDNSADKRLSNAQNIFNQANSQGGAPSGPSPADVAGPSASPPLGPVAPVASTAATPNNQNQQQHQNQWANALGAIAKQYQQQEQGLSTPEPAIQFVQQPNNRAQLAQYLQNLQRT